MEAVSCPRMPRPRWSRTLGVVSQTDRYGRIAGVYDLIVEPLQAGVRRAGVRFLPPQPGWRVLDVGCGTGTGMVPYVDAGCDVVGVDVSAAMLDKATARLGGRAEVHLTDGSGLPFADGSFDLVMTSMVLHEIPHEARPRFLEEMARVAGPDGRLLITDFHFGPLRGWRGPVNRAVSILIERFSGHYSGYRSFAATGGVPGLIAALGMAIEEEKVVAGGNLGLFAISPDGSRAGESEEQGR